MLEGGGGGDGGGDSASPTFIGVLMAIVGSSLIGISYTASKFAHNKVLDQFLLQQQQRKQQPTANQPKDSPPAYNVSREEDGGDNNNIISKNDESQHLLQRHHSPNALTVLSPASDTPLFIDIDYINDDTSDTDADAEAEAAAAEAAEVEAEIEAYRYSMRSTMRMKEWWFSIIFLLAGECFNFLAYGFAPTSLIAPLGTLSIISGAVSGYIYLGERIRGRNIMGMLLSVFGAVVIVLSSRDSEPHLTPEAIVEALCQLQFLIYLGISVLLTTVLLVLDSCRMPDKFCLASTVDGRIIDCYGDRFVVVRVGLTALFSGYTVLCTKAISSLLSLSFVKMFAYWISWLLLFMLLVNALLAVYYTNKALAAFDSTRVLPAEFAAFTFSAVLGSAMMYNDFDDAKWWQILVFIAGCSLTFLGVYFITSDSEKFGKSVSERASIAIVTGGLPFADTRPYSSLSLRDSSTFPSNTGLVRRFDALTDFSRSSRNTLPPSLSDRRTFGDDLLPTSRFSTLLNGTWRTSLGEKYWNRRHQQQQQQEPSSALHRHESDDSDAIATTTTANNIAVVPVVDENAVKTPASAAASDSRSSFHTTYETFSTQPPPDAPTLFEELKRSLGVGAGCSKSNNGSTLSNHERYHHQTPSAMQRFSQNVGTLLDTVSSSSRASLTFQQVVMPSHSQYHPHSYHHHPINYHHHPINYHHDHDNSLYGSGGGDGSLTLVQSRRKVPSNVNLDAGITDELLTAVRENSGLTAVREQPALSVATTSSTLNLSTNSYDDDETAGNNISGRKQQSKRESIKLATRALKKKFNYHQRRTQEKPTDDSNA